MSGCLVGTAFGVRMTMSSSKACAEDGIFLEGSAEAQPLPRDKESQRGCTTQRRRGAKVRRLMVEGTACVRCSPRPRAAGPRLLHGRGATDNTRAARAATQ
eukprot:2549670-Prymnesium_polylepis.1